MKFLKKIKQVPYIKTENNIEVVCPRCYKIHVIEVWHSGKNKIRCSNCGTLFLFQEGQQ